MVKSAFLRVIGSAFLPGGSRRVISQMSDGLDDGHQVAWILLWGGDIRGFSGGLVYIHVLTHSELMDISRQ